MSGLVIARAYEAKLLAGSMSFGQFCRVRFIRLYPLYFSSLILGLSYAIIKTILKPEEAITFTQGVVSFSLNAAFLPDVVMSRSDIFPFNPAAWSLALEWAINIVYAIWAVRQSNARLLVITVLAGVALVPVAVDYGSVDMGWGLVTGLGGVLRICFSFTLGVIFYRQLASGKLRLPAVHSLVLLGVLMLFMLTPFGGSGVWYDLFCVYVVFPLFVLFACSTGTPEKLKSSFAFLGLQSYAIYILHTPLMLWFGGLWKMVTRTEPAESTYISGVLLLSFIVIAAYIATRWFDEPARRLMLSLSKKRT